MVKRSLRISYCIVTIRSKCFILPLGFKGGSKVWGSAQRWRVVLCVETGWAARQENYHKEKNWMWIKVKIQLLIPQEKMKNEHRTE